ncbi:MFS transporter [Cryobacterium tagatosivorans]|uniref:MFS transporter n=1 Tax=Cryobacterium tagatosivorans TaxID=1259199 RepID=A0A4R8UGK4_9MICO|nr:MFS transporter [Cryobacterium tagatosivorans]TFB53073.1 MFS transporter [Cryobacterium tagatosivorans]
MRDDATTGTPPRRRPRLPRAAQPFREGQYRVLIGAMTLSLFGAGMWLVAVVWQVIELGGGPAELSIVATGSAAGLLAAVLIGGVAADRIPQRRIMITVEATKTVAIGVAAFLAFTGTVDVWNLAAISFALGVADGFFYPAYSALLPSILPAEQLLAANGVEGMLRPMVMQAAGPAAASAAIAASSPGFAFALIAAAQLLAALGLAILRPTALRREPPDPDAPRRHPFLSVLADMRAGFAYMVRTPWLLGTLSYFTVLVLVLMGPIEVLLPFAVKDQAGGGPAGFALALAAFGIGGAAGSLVVASRRLPRRYLTVMNVLWGVGCVPLAVIGLTSQLWVMILALFLVGFAFQAGTVIWGTLLQRRVPPAMLGRVSSLDFFVSLAFMPVSMALAGPVGEAIGLAPAFLIAGLVPPVLALSAIVIFRMPRDELRHPLDRELDSDSDQDQGPTRS